MPPARMYETTSIDRCELEGEKWNVMVDFISLDHFFSTISVLGITGQDRSPTFSEVRHIQCFGTSNAKITTCNSVFCSSIWRWCGFHRLRAASAVPRENRNALFLAFVRYLARKYHNSFARPRPHVPISPTKYNITTHI